MNCSKIKSELAAYSQGQSSASERSAIESHLQECASCREELSDFFATTQVLKATFPTLIVPDHLTNAVLIKVSNTRQIKGKRIWNYWQFKRAFDFLLRPVPALATLLVLVTSYVVFFSESPAAQFARSSTLASTQVHQADADIWLEQQWANYLHTLEDNERLSLVNGQNLGVRNGMTTTVESDRAERIRVTHDLSFPADKTQENRVECEIFLASL